MTTPPSQLQIDPEWKEAFATRGWRSLDDVLGDRDHEVIKAAVVGKTVRRTELAAGRWVYLKCFETIPRRDRRRALLSQGASRSAAGREHAALVRLRKLGLTAPKPLALAEDRRGLFGAVHRAVLVTEGLPAAPTLEELVMAERNDELWPPSRRRALAHHLGTLLRQMHEGGLNHRDFYAGHLRVVDEAHLQILDLDRADLRKIVGRRWRVKDLAALDFSLPLDRVTARERLQMLRAYLGAPLTSDPILIREVAQKSAAILAHARKKVARGDLNIHINK